MDLYSLFDVDTVLSQRNGFRSAVKAGIGDFVKISCIIRTYTNKRPERVNLFSI